MHMDGTTEPASQNLPRGRKRPRYIMELHMTFLPKSFRTPELLGFFAAIPAAFAGSVLFLYMMDVTSRVSI